MISFLTRCCVWDGGRLGSATQVTLVRRPVRGLGAGCTAGLNPAQHQCS